MHNSIRTSVLAGAACAALTLGAGTVNAAPVEWTIASGGNGHFYDFISSESLFFWGPARDDALSRTHNGQQGYLITFTSAAEQAFYISQFGAVDGWTGANDLAEEGKWVWVDGPEAGQQFWSGAAGGSVTAPSNYASWAAGEPNNLTQSINGVPFGDEDVAEFDGGNWNDLSYVAGVAGHRLGGYLIEYGVSAVPEPMTLSLLCLGLLGIGALRRRPEALKTPNLMRQGRFD